MRRMSLAWTSTSSHGDRNCLCAETSHRSAYICSWLAFLAYGLIGSGASSPSGSGTVSRNLDPDMGVRQFSLCRACSCGA